VDKSKRNPSRTRRDVCSKGGAAEPGSGWRWMLGCVSKKACTEAAEASSIPCNNPKGKIRLPKGMITWMRQGSAWMWRPLLVSVLA